MLDEAFEGIVKALLESRGGAVPSPVGLHKARDALRLLVEDGYTEEQILTVLRWIWSEDHKDARFWRKQVASIAGLRKDPESKFAKVFLAWKGAKGFDRYYLAKFVRGCSS